MIAEAIRTRVAVFFLCLIGLVIVGLPFTARGDGTASGAVQSFLTYALGCLSFFLALLTLFMSRSLSDEFVRQQIFLLMTKPLPRWQFMIGKWLGIVLFNAALLAIAGGGVYGMTRLMVAMAEPRDEWDRNKLGNEVLVARHHAPLVVPWDMLRKQANAIFERRLEEGLYADAIDFDEKAARADLLKQVETRWRFVGVGESRLLRFEDVRCDTGSDKRVHIRYKASAMTPPIDEVIRTVWLAGDRPYLVPTRAVNDRYHTLPIPADAVSPDGTLTVRFVNVNPYVGDPRYPNDVENRSVFRFSESETVEVLFEVGTFGGNLARVLALIWLKLTFLAAVGLLTTCVFSFPVASLVALTVYVLAAFRGFIQEAVEWVGDEGALMVFQSVFTLVCKALFFVVPDFPYYDAIHVLVDGRNVPLRWVLEGMVGLLLIPTGITLMLACLLFQRREVAEVSV
jgi:hypothetical protein